MNCSSRFLATLYIATSAGLAWTAVLEYWYGPMWAACLFAAASIVPVIGVVRESVIGDQRRALADRARRAAVPGPSGAGPDLDAAEDIVRAELDGACCERWWTSLGCDHDRGCPHRIPRSSAA
ncbi:hypothetical protein STRCI_007533 [Streptomyces cinnabarinus]|uniref:Uncharacterized protein n=1 Tax=Streptomyces cinnabarinus TaxID=67287 RepID=A0ABY7KN52_9ACTN|nr:hypothetical protein [Streptomyces cinnabarinus]WAZ25996.1 hypothetical protein STRCI_007533 [Streptomyces cinnabarinus]